jgi:hypothetical protein
MSAWMEQYLLLMVDVDCTVRGSGSRARIDAHVAALVAENERLRGWMSRFAHVACLTELLGEGMCESGEECPGCTARAMLDATEGRTA